MYKPILFLGCTHLGFEFADIAYTKKALKWARNENAGIFVLSDNMEFALPHKGKMMYAQIMSPEKQIEACLELLGGVADLIVAGVTGNHVNRAYEVAGVDVDKMIFDKLGLLDKYHGDQGFINIKVGKVNYSIAFTHGVDCGSDVFRNNRKLLKMYPSADICASSHTHKNAYTNEGFFEWDKNGKRVIRTVHFISTGSNLEYPRYAAKALYSPQTKGYARALLNAEEREVLPDVTGIF